MTVRSRNAHLHGTTIDVGGIVYAIGPDGLLDAPPHIEDELASQFHNWDRVTVAAADAPAHRVIVPDVPSESVAAHRPPQTTTETVTVKTPQEAAARRNDASKKRAKVASNAGARQANLRPGLPGEAGHGAGGK